MGTRVRKLSLAETAEERGLTNGGNDKDDEEGVCPARDSQSHRDGGRTTREGEGSAHGPNGV